MNFKVFYSVSIQYEDNTWLQTELEKYGSVEVIGVADFWYKLRNWQLSSSWGWLINIFVSTYQAVKLIYSTDKHDIVITRSHGVGLIFMFIVNVLHLNRRLVSYNWIEMPKKRYAYLAKIALSKKNFIPVVNDKRLLKLIKKKFNLKEMMGVYIPDTYDIKDQFCCPCIKNRKYVFSGGMNNRDWDTLLQVADMIPDMDFYIVTNKYLWSRKYLPCNVKVYFDLPVEEYYQMLRESYLCIIPLKEDRVSGLINIIKAHQYGVPTITTNMGCTHIYYPQEVLDKCLYISGDVNSLIEKIKNVQEMSEVDYLNFSSNLQAYLKKKFAADILVKRLIDYIIQVKWGTVKNAEVCSRSGSV